MASIKIDIRLVTGETQHILHTLCLVNTNPPRLSQTNNNWLAYIIYGRLSDSEFHDDYAYIFSTYRIISENHLFCNSISNKNLK